MMIGNKVEIVAHSVDTRGNEIISVLATFPRIILAEINTHRMLSKNTSSSRAIPFKKMVEAVQNNPFIPIAWQKDHKGMQGSEYFTERINIETTDLGDLKYAWLEARDYAVKQATWLNKVGVTKQLCNRLLEPFMWTTMLITGSKEGWGNFFSLRCPQYHYDLEDKYFKSKKEWLDYYRTNCIGDPNSNFELDEMDWFSINKGQAEIHIMDLAECIWDAYNESTPKQLKAGEWHIPFGDKMDISSEEYINITGKVILKTEDLIKIKVKSSVAMAARTSYTVVGEEKDIDYKKMIELHDRLLTQDPPHSSPMEHCAQCMTDLQYQNYTRVVNVTDLNEPEVEFGWCRNFKGFIPYRHIIETKKELKVLK